MYRNIYVTECIDEIHQTLRDSRALAASRLDDHHVDPIDRLLVFQAKEERMRSVATDPLAAYGIDVLDPTR